ncbi:MAG: efflux RND transporter periplasmic adaptor subunit [Bacteroidales bacterium]|nr:efflux RND transporter periplasmic adaptor subunit [Bacteroidales bacterium]
MKRHYYQVFLFTILTIIIYACQGDETSNSKTAKADPAIETFVAEAGAINEIIKASGSIQPNEKMELRSEVAGRIVAVNFKEGTHIDKGALLVQIDDSELMAQLQKFNAQMRIAREDENRKKQLLSINGISQEVYDGALAKVEELEADIALTDSKIRKSKIESPFSGKIGLRYVSQGTWVSQGEIISTLVQTDPVKIEFSIPERYASLISVGMKAVFTVAGSDKDYTATIYATEPQIDANTRSLKVRALRANPKGELIPGAFAEITINLRQIPDALMIPTLCVVPLLNSQNIFVIRDGAAKLIEVETGIRRDKYVQITSGIVAGDTIAISGLLLLKDGMAVSVKSTEKITNPDQR